MRFLFTCFLVFGLYANAETSTFLLMHTNDLHDHVRPDYDGTGGISYVSGYVQSVREKRDDILLLDAGDVMEKGDFVAFRTQSKMMYEAMRKIGYDAIAPGNHDDVYGHDHLQQCDEMMPDTAILCINLFDKQGNLIFPASKMFTVNQLKIGVIGMIRPRDEQSLDLEASAHAIAKEAQKLDQEAHLIVVTVHEGVVACREMAKIAPMVDVWVSGHNHQALQQPVILEDNGALVVQAGSYAEYVGELELTVDLETEELLDYNGRLVEMKHDATPNDEEMLTWIRGEEQRLCPEATRRIATIDKPLGALQLSYLAAESIREAGNADIAFLHAGQIIRDSLPVGEVDYNALFRTGGQRAYDIIEIQALGSVIDAYVGGLRRTGWGTTQWSGFRAGEVKDVSGKRFKSDLDPDKIYRVLMAQKEWDTRFAKFFEDNYKPQGASEAEHIQSWKPVHTDITFTDAIAQYLEKHNLDNEAIHDKAKDIIDATELK